MARGYSLIEMLVATALTLVVTAGALAMLVPGQAAALAEPAAVDMQQRMRVASDLIYRDVLNAGAGVESGPAFGPLVRALPPVVPRRMGVQSPDATTVARADAITITFVPATPTETTLAAAWPAATNLSVAASPNCPIGQAACGFTAGAATLVFDASGHWDLSRVTSVQGAIVQLQSLGPASGWPYAAGAAVAQARRVTYYFDPINLQLRQYDNYQTDQPVADNVVALAFEYFGDPSSPVAPKPPIGTANCLYDAQGGWHPLPTLAAPSGALAPLPLSMLNDGPWCGSGGTQFDADLLRVRQVRVTIRIQATASELRAHSTAFLRPGSSTSSRRYVPDLVMTFDVSPPNLGITS